MSDPIAPGAGLNVSRETFARLESYAALLRKWNRAINLIGRDSEPDLWRRHIADSLALVKAIPAQARSLADLGSGGGLPGLVIAIARPDLAITLIERDQRKSAFLSEATQQLSLRNVTVLARDIADASGVFDVATARALAPLDALFSLVFPLLHENSTCLFPKGSRYAIEMQAAQQGWQFTCEAQPSDLEAGAALLVIRHLKPLARGQI